MLKYVNTDVVFQEIPDETTLAINISNCPCHCPGCHSSYLWKDIGNPLTDAELSALINEVKGQATCICFMGGDAEPAEVNRLAAFVHKNFPHLHTGWYTGRTLISSAVDKRNFDYIKVGPYIRHLGPLKSKTTNQRLYRFHSDGSSDDITSRFWKK